MAFLTLLESLTPAERAVFLLREVFSYDYQAVAEATGKSEAACRQLLARARQAIAERRQRFSSSRADAERVTSIFLDVSNGADIASLLERLAPDVVFYGDSGGNGEVTFIEPVHGRDQVAEILIFQLARARRLDAHLEPAMINGMPGLLAYATDGLIAATTLDVLDGQIQALRIVANPDKLRHIGPVSASWHLRAAGDDNDLRDRFR
jgi:RNA polymerase sigma-70 factor (ECF subfamily)